MIFSRGDSAERYLCAKNHCYRAFSWAKMASTEIHKASAIEGTNLRPQGLHEPLRLWTCLVTSHQATAGRTFFRQSAVLVIGLADASNIFGAPDPQRPLLAARSISLHLNWENKSACGTEIVIITIIIIQHEPLSVISNQDY